MASEETGGARSLTVPAELEEWLETRAKEAGTDPQTYLRELLVAHRAVEEETVGDDGTAAWDAVDGSDLERRIDDVRAEFMELLEDVRERVIQVKRETDAKAPADHEHADLAEELAVTVDALGQVETELDSAREDLDALQSDVDAGFANYEEILEYVLDRSDDFDQQVTRLARATIKTRERLTELSGMLRERAVVGDLKHVAQTNGITAANCESCDRSVRPALLTEPECPYCATPFVDLEPKQGLLGSARFLTGDRPALAGETTDDLATEIEEALDDDEHPPPGDVDWGTASRDDQ